MIGTDLPLPKVGLLLSLLLALGLALPSLAFAAGPPSIPAAWVTGVDADSAVLHAEVDAGGLATRYRFEYLSLAAYEANLGAGREAFADAAMVPSSGSGIGSGTAAVAVAFTLVAPANPLAPSTAYRYRAVATNSAGSAVTEAHALRTRAAGPPPGLPDGRGWEMVSPVEKDGGAVGAPESIFGGGDFQAAADGDSLTFSSTSSFGEAQGAPPASQYVATRTGAGWLSENVTLPTLGGAYGDRPDGVPYQLFSSDLGRSLMSDGGRCGTGEACPRAYSLLEPPGVVTATSPAAAGLSVVGATPDLHQIILSTCAALTAEAFEEKEGAGCRAEDPNLYEWEGGGPTLIDASPGEVLPPPFGRLAAPIGAISESGARVYWQEVGGAQGLRLFESGGPSHSLPSSVSGGEFQAASADGGLAYFTRAGILYRYSVASEESTAIASGITGVLAVSADGSYVYYQDAGALKYWHDGVTGTIVDGAAVAVPSDYPPATATVRLAAGGRILAFLSAASIGGYDNTDAVSGLPDEEAYIFDAASGSLLCASCNPTGERPTGSARIPGAMVNGATVAYRPRALNADGRRLFFDTTDAFLGSDTDSTTDVYEWEAAGEGGCAEAPGCLGLISGGRAEGGRFLDASESGSDVFFLTGDPLVGADPGSIDVYDARIGGGFPEPEAPFVCKGDACQALPSPPEDPSPGTLVPSAGNPAPKIERLKEPRRCGKGKVRRNGVCLRRLHRHRRQKRTHR